MRLNFFIAVLVTLLNVSATSAEVSEIPSVVAWELKTPERVVYVVGEIHYFDVTSGKTVDHTLAKKIYDLSQTYWTENFAEVPARPNPYKPNSSRVSTETWIQFKQALKFFLLTNKSKQSEPTSDALFDELLLLFDRNEPLVALSDASKFIAAKSMRLAKTRALVVDGFMSEEVAKYEMSQKQKKIKALESVTSAYEAWDKNCASNSDAEEVFKAITSLLSQTLAFNERASLRATDWFLGIQGVAKYEDIKLLASPESDFFKRCMIAPRSKEWLPTFTNVLTTSGESVAFLVGIGHLVGEDGIFEMLKKNSVTFSIKRIYGLE